MREQRFAQEDERHESNNPEGTPKQVFRYQHSFQKFPAKVCPWCDYTKEDPTGPSTEHTPHSPALQNIACTMGHTQDRRPNFTASARPPPLPLPLLSIHRLQDSLSQFGTQVIKCLRLRTWNTAPPNGCTIIASIAVFVAAAKSTARVGFVLCD